MSGFVLVYKETPEQRWENLDWFDSLDAAKAKFDKLAEARQFKMGRGKRASIVHLCALAVFPDHLLQYGEELGKPRLVIDFTDKRGAPIYGAEGLINSLESDWF